MTEKKAEITICMGSSCFSRGNKKTVPFLQNYLKEKGLSDEIHLKGAHCMGNCDKGPLLKINDEVVYHVDQNDLEDFLAEKLGI